MRHLLLAAVCAAALLPAFRPARAAETKTTLNIALREDPDVLDPTLSRTYVGRIVFAGLCDKLFDINEKLQIVPQLATGYEWADPKTLVIHLRHGVLFQDGEKFDAAAAKYSLERHLNMPGSNRRGEISAMDKVEVVDPYTIRILLKEPSAPFLAQLTDRAGMMVAPQAAEKEGKNFGLHPVCAGPFRFVERVPQDRIVLERFPDYWNKGAIHFDRVVYRPMPNASVRVDNLRAGSIDLSEQILPTDVAAVQQDPKLRVVTSNSLGYQGITINIANGKGANSPLAHDPRVRKAFELAIDRKALVDVVYSGMYTPTAQAIPPGSPFYDAALTPPARDLARAKALLKETGLKLPVPVTLLTTTNSDMQQVAEVIQSMANEAGFDVKIRTMEFAASLNAARAGDFEAYLLAWSGRIDPDGNTYIFLHSGGALNESHYANGLVDQALDQGRTLTDVAQRKQAYDRMWRQEAQDLPIVYLWNPKNIVGMSKRLVGFRPIPDGMIRLQGLSFGK